MFDFFFLIMPSNSRRGKTLMYVWRFYLILFKTSRVSCYVGCFCLLICSFYEIPKLRVSLE